MQNPKRFISRPTQTMAMQWTGNNGPELVNWTGGAFHENYTMPSQLWVAANENFLELEIGEWIIEDELGFYPCKNNVFAKKYRVMLDDEAVTVEFGHVYFRDGAHSTPSTNGIPLVPIRPGDDISTEDGKVWLDTADGKHIPIGKVGN